MTSLSSATAVIADLVNNFLGVLSFQSGVSVENLTKYWILASKNDTPKNVTTTEKHETRGRKIDPNSVRCPYVFQNGKNPGSKCNANVKDPESSQFCSKHAKSAESSQFFGRTAATIAGIASVSTALTSSGSVYKPPTRTVEVKKNDYGNHEHSLTNLVFNPETACVYGKQIEDKVLPLTSSDIEKCIFYKFKWDPNCLAKPDSKDPTSDETEYMSSDETPQEVDEIDVSEEEFESESD